tara:strand:- start:27 stop:224 length:198 start_codon:yes stop_codon:yes gene_type:complete
MIKRILTREVIKQDNCKIIVDKITDMMAGINAKISKKFPINIKINKIEDIYDKRWYKVKNWDQVI